MARVRVIKGLCEAFKGAVPSAGMPKGSFPNVVGVLKPQQEPSPPEDNVHGRGVQTDRTLTNRVTKKVQSRVLRASRFGDHGSSTAFKKVVRRRERFNASVLGLPSSPPILYDVRTQSSECDSHHSSPSPVSSGVEEAQSFLPHSAIKGIPSVPCVESESDEMEEILPAPLIYQQAEGTVRSLPPVYVQPSIVPVSPVQAQSLHIPHPAQPVSPPPPALAVRSPVSQPPSTAASATQLVPQSHPFQSHQLLPTMSHFCRNLCRVTKEMTYVLRATRSSCGSTVLARVPPTPTKRKLSYARTSALCSDSDG